MSAHLENLFQNNNHMFARDVIYYVLEEYMEGLQWDANGVFAYADTNTPCTPHVKAVIKEMLNNTGNYLHEFYDRDFPNRTSHEINHFEVCKTMKDVFIRRDRHINTLIALAILLAYYAALSYHYGCESAPFDSYYLLVTGIGEMKNMGQVSFNMWDQMQSNVDELAKFIQV